MMRLPLSYLPIHLVDREAIMAEMDDETIGSVCGPGTSRSDYEMQLEATSDDLHWWGILEDGRYVGNVVFAEIRSTMPNFGVHIVRAHRRRGIARQAWAELNHLYGDSIRAECWADNLAIRTLLESLGFGLRRLRGDDGRPTAHYMILTGARPEIGTAFGELLDVVQDGETQEEAEQCSC